MEKIATFEERNAPANLPAGSPFWRDVDPREQSNYVNSPRSQEFLQQVHPKPFSLLEPNTWIPRVGTGVTHPSPLAADKSLSPEIRAMLDAITDGESPGGAYDSQNPTSSAQGRYQIIDSTNRDISPKIGLSPADMSLSRRTRRGRR